MLPFGDFLSWVVQLVFDTLAHRLLELFRPDEPRQSYSNTANVVLALAPSVKAKFFAQVFHHSTSIM